MKTFVMSAILLLSASAFANDSTMPYIEVSDLTFKNADVGTSIKFRGADARSLFNVLPNQDAMGYSHGFTATGKKKSVAIQCSTHSWDNKKNDFYEIQNGPECSIVVETAYDPNNDESDHSKWIADRAPQSVKKDAKTDTKEVKKTKKK